MPNLMLGNFAKQAAKLRFQSYKITLPAIAGSSPAAAMRPGMSPPPSAAFGLRPVAAAAPLPFPPALFRAASNSKADVDRQRSMHDTYNALFDGVIDAVEFGFNLYRLTAGLADVMINGPTAIGGRLQGQPLGQLIKCAPSVAAWSGLNAQVRDAVAGGMEQQWSLLANCVKVPGLPWYPTFAAFPGPMAPPTPNVPCPFAMLQHDANAMSPANLKNAMRFSLHGNVDYCTEFFDSVATALEMPLTQWKTSQMVTMVMGMGQVPTFAPPYVPVGPVVAGKIIPGPHINT